MARVGRYEIESELGRGGMGVVYRALDTELGRPVALKMILDPSRAGPEQIARFRREAAACTQLRHPGVVAVYDTGEHEGKPFLVMELVPGESFEALLEKGGLSPKRIAEIVQGVALALDHAHSKGIVHRDVKPENVIVDRSGQPRLMDFGLAHQDDDSTRLTSTGAFLGTPAYMAPEQAEGTPRGQGTWTDVYALGAVLYRALVGRPPFKATPVQALLWQIITKEPTPPRKLDPEIHADLETIALRCLAKEPARRLASAKEVADELGRFLDGRPIHARPIGRVERAQVWTRRNPKLAALSLVAIALAVALPFVILPVLRENALVHRDRAVRAAIVSAEARLARNENAVAFAEISRAIESMPGEARLWATRGNVRFAQGDLAGAISDFTRAVEIDPRNGAAWHNRGAMREKRGELDGAIADMTRAIEAEPTNVVHLGDRGRLKDLKHDPDGAIADFTRALEIDPTSAGAWGRLAPRA